MKMKLSQQLIKIQRTVKKLLSPNSVLGDFEFDYFKHGLLISKYHDKFTTFYKEMFCSI